MLSPSSNQIQLPFGQIQCANCNNVLLENEMFGHPFFFVFPFLSCTYSVLFKFMCLFIYSNIRIQKSN